MDYRAEVPELTAPRYDYLFQHQYQSTDESAVEEVPSSVIDPQSDNGNSPTAPVTRTIWYSRAPAHRKKRVSSLIKAGGQRLTCTSIQTNRLLDRVDAKVVLGRKSAKKTTTRGNTHTIRRRGPSRPDDKSKLPLIPKGPDRVLIPRSEISKRWLATKAGREFDDRTYYTDDGEDDGGDTGSSLAEESAEDDEEGGPPSGDDGPPGGGGGEDGGDGGDGGDGNGGDVGEQ